MGAIKDKTLSRKTIRFMAMDSDTPARMCDVCEAWPAPWRNGVRGRLCSLCYPLVTGRRVH